MIHRSLIQPQHFHRSTFPKLLLYSYMMFSLRLFLLWCFVLVATFHQFESSIDSCSCSRIVPSTSWSRHSDRFELLSLVNDYLDWSFNLRPFNDYQSNQDEYLIPNARRYMNSEDMKMLDMCAFERDIWLYDPLRLMQCQKIADGPTLPTDVTFRYMMYRTVYLQLLEEETRAMKAIEVCARRHYFTKSLSIECIGIINRVLIDFDMMTRSPKELRMQQYFYDYLTQAVPSFVKLSWPSARKSLEKDAQEILGSSSEQVDSEYANLFRKLNGSVQYLNPGQMEHVNICVYKKGHWSEQSWNQFCLPLVHNYGGTISGLLLQTAYLELVEQDRQDKLDVEACTCQPRSFHCSALLFRIMKNFNTYTRDYQDTRMRQYHDEALELCPLHCTIC